MVARQALAYQALEQPGNDNGSYHVISAAVSRDSSVSPDSGHSQPESLDSLCNGSFRRVTQFSGFLNSFCCLDHEKLYVMYAILEQEGMPDFKPLYEKIIEIADLFEKQKDNNLKRYAAHLREQAERIAKIALPENFTEKANNALHEYFMLPEFPQQRLYDTFAWHSLQHEINNALMLLPYIRLALYNGHFKKGSYEHALLKEIYSLGTEFADRFRKLVPGASLDEISGSATNSYSGAEYRRAA